MEKPRSNRKKLKEYAYTGENFETVLRHISNEGTGESWQNFIRGIFNTKYIKNLVNNSSFEFINEKIKYPTANLCIYLFFLNYAVNKTILWQNDYVWCSDLDSNGDNIYVGRYYDINKVSKDGFSIHRHLKLKSNYGSIDFY